MNDSTSVYADELSVLKNKYRLLMGMMFGLIILWMITIIGQFSASAQSSEKKESIDKNSIQQSLQVRELVIVDKNGTPRVRIGGNLPDPIMLGKRSKRGEDLGGIIVYDGEGNERGGYVTGDRSVALTLDEINRAAVHLGINDKGEMHFFLSNGRGGFAGLGVVPTGSWFRLDAPGKSPVILPNPSEGATK